MSYSEVIVVPGASGKRGIRRLAGALYAYREEKEKGYRPLIVLSGYDYFEIKSILDVFSKEIPFAFEFNSTTTKENALYTSNLLKSLEMMNVLQLKKLKLTVVTDTVHYGRAKMIFSEVFDNPKVEVVGYTNIKEMMKDLQHELFAYIVGVLPSSAKKKLVSFFRRSYQSMKKDT